MCRKRCGRQQLVAWALEQGVCWAGGGVVGARSGGKPHRGPKELGDLRQQKHICPWHVQGPGRSSVPHTVPPVPGHALPQAMARTRRPGHNEPADLCMPALAARRPGAVACVPHAWLWLPPCRYSARMAPTFLKRPVPVASSVSRPLGSSWCSVMSTCTVALPLPGTSAPPLSLAT